MDNTSSTARSSPEEAAEQEFQVWRKEREEADDEINLFPGNMSGMTATACMICLEDFHSAGGPMVACVPCGHCLHKACYDEARCVSRYSTCALCMQTVEQAVQLFLELPGETTNNNEDDDKFEMFVNELNRTKKDLSIARTQNNIHMVDKLLLSQARREMSALSEKNAALESELHKERKEKQKLVEALATIRQTVSGLDGSTAASSHSTSCNISERLSGCKRRNDGTTTALKQTPAQPPNSAVAPHTRQNCRRVTRSPPLPPPPPSSPVELIRLLSPATTSTTHRSPSPQQDSSTLSSISSPVSAPFSSSSDSVMSFTLDGPPSISWVSDSGVSDLLGLQLDK